MLASANRRIANTPATALIRVSLVLVVVACATESNAAEPVFSRPPNPWAEEEVWGGCLVDWADNEWRLFPADGRRRPQTLFAWPGNERSLVDGQDEGALVSDRPGFTEATTTVGRGHLQLESGYTLTRDESSAEAVNSHSFPELLLRLGIAAEWLELRLGWNSGVDRRQSGNVSSTFDGEKDLYVGLKLALTEQDGWLPEFSLLPQMSVPTGSDEYSSHVLMPGCGFLYAWNLNEVFSISGSMQINRVRDDADDLYAEIAQSWSIGYALTDQLAAYTEWFAFFPHNADVAKPRHHFDGGFTYQFHPNWQVDLWAGMGLNDAADDFIMGAGTVLRF